MALCFIFLSFNNVKAKAQTKRSTSDITLSSTENSTVQIANTVFGSKTKAVVSTGTAITLENSVSSQKTPKTLLQSSLYSIANTAHTHTDNCYVNGRYTPTLDTSIELGPGFLSMDSAMSSSNYCVWRDYTTQVGAHRGYEGTMVGFVFMYFHPAQYSLENLPNRYKFFLSYPDNVTAAAQQDNIATSIKWDVYNNKIAKLDSNNNVTNCDEVMNYILNKYEELGYTIIPMENTPYYKYLHILKTYSQGGYDPSCSIYESLVLTDDGYINLVSPTEKQSNKIYYYKLTENTPVCDKVITALSPVNPTQTIYQGNSIDTSAVATYLDGHTAIINCTTDFNVNVAGIGQIATIYAPEGYIHTAKQTGRFTDGITVNVIPKLTGITVTPSSTVVYNGSEPTYTVVANYADGTKKSVSEGNYTKTGWFSGYGIKTVNFTYTESGKKVSKTVTITVKPNLTGLTVTASDTWVYYGTNISFVTKAEYEDGSTATVNSSNETQYSKTTVGEQNISYSYSENNITKRASENVTVLDYPVSLRVGLKQDWIYQGQKISIDSAKATLASGKEIDISPSISDYDNITVDNIAIKFSYFLNGREVSTTVPVEVKPDLYDLKLSGTDFTIYKGHSLGLSVTASFHVEGDQKLSSDEYTISGFDNNTYDRAGKYYTVSYTNKGVTKTKSVFIKVLPNISDISVSVATQTTEGTYIPFTMVVTYEDGKTKILTQADVGIVGNGLSVNNYDINKVGYQDVTFAYSEGGKTLTKVVTVRVRAIIRVSIPVSMLVTINPNGNGFISPNLKIDNQSKESVLVGINSVSSDSSSGLKNVLPSAHTDWSKLGLSYENDLALGLECKSNWVNDYLKNPLYVCQVTDKKDIGVLDKKSSGCVGFTAKYCNAQSKQRNFAYVINWFIKLSEN